MKIFTVIALIIIIFGSALISIKQPKMHSRVLVYDSQYIVVDEDEEKDAVRNIVETADIPTMSVENNLTKEEIIFGDENTSEIQQVKTTTTQKPQKTAVEKKTQTSPKTVKTQQKPTTQSAITTVKNNSEHKKTEVKTAQNTNTVTTSTTTTNTNANYNNTSYTYKPAESAVKVLTKQEEEIAWNRWRSALQNQIMKDTRLPAIPYGTIFFVNFDVDKNGRVSNVQTWASDSKYTPYAIEYIAPVVRGYQGKAILTFPEGSQRTITKFEGKWKISQTAKYSSPNDYNDYEKVTK